MPQCGIVDFDLTDTDGYLITDVASSMFEFTEFDVDGDAQGLRIYTENL